MQRASYGERDYAFGQLILTLRTTIGLTQGELAHKLGVSRNAVAQWEGGNSYPNAQHLKSLIELGVQAVAFSSAHEEEEIRTIWRAAHQKVLLDEHWLLKLLDRSTPSKGVYMEGNGEQRSTSAAHQIAIWMIPFARNAYFTGRSELLDQLSLQLSLPTSGLPTAVHRAALTQAQAIKGLGGIGKTQIAVEYAYRARDAGRYIHTFWISAESSETVLMSFAALAERLPDFSFRREKDQHQLVTAVVRWLEHCQEPWLLIVDNADDPSLVHPYLPVQGNGSILLTTRTSAVGWLASFLEVDSMGIIEGAELLLRRAGRYDQASDEQINEAATLVIELAQFPLALDQAGAYIEETRCNISDYRELYQTHRQTLLARRGRQAMHYPSSVATTWSLSFEHVARTNSAAAQLLQLCTFLSPDHIPENLFTKGAAYWPPTLRDAVKDRLRFNQMVETLLSFSLVKRIAESQILCVHRLVQTVQMERLTREERYQWGERVVRAVNTVFPHDPQEAEQWSTCQHYLDQVQTCDSLIREQQIPLPEASELLDRAGTYLSERGLYGLAEPLYRHALSMRERHVGEEHPTSIQSMIHLANLSFRQGKFAQAEVLYQRALSLAERQTAAEQSLLVDALRGLAHVYGDQGKYAQAEALYQRAFPIWKQLGEAEQVKLHSILTGLAFVQAQQGKYTEAERLSKLALYFLEQHLGETHPKVASALLGLAQITTLKEPNAQVESLNQRALHIREQYFGPEHPLVASALHALARLYSGQRKYVEAEPLYQRALHIREQHLGPEHLEVSDSLRGLANLFFKEGKYTEAEPLYQRALHIREQHFGPESPVIIDVILGLANLYREQGKFTQAEPLYQRALHICQQQPKRLETADVLHDFASFRHAQGQAREAVVLYQRALAIRETLLGASHPLVAETREHLQELLGAIDQMSAAKCMEAQQHKG